MYYIESKATWDSNFSFSMISEFQYNSLLEKSKIPGVYGYVIVLFASYKRAFKVHINEIDKVKQSGKNSLNIKKIDKWGIEYEEIQTIPSRKDLLDYTGGTW